MIGAAAGFFVADAGVGDITVFPVDVVAVGVRAVEGDGAIEEPAHEESRSKAKSIVIIK
jgi:hypothetical protein